MVSEVSGCCDGQYILTTESSDTDFGSLIGVVGPVFTVKADDNDVVRQVVSDGGDLLNAPATDAVLPDFEVAGLFEVGLERDDCRISTIRCGTYTDFIKAGFECDDRGILNIRLSTYGWGSGDRNRPTSGVLGHDGVA